MWPGAQRPNQAPLSDSPLAYPQMPSAQCLGYSAKDHQYARNSPWVAISQHAQQHPQQLQHCTQMIRVQASGFWTFGGIQLGQHRVAWSDSKYQVVTDSPEARLQQEEKNHHNSRFSITWHGPYPAPAPENNYTNEGHKEDEELSSLNFSMIAKSTNNFSINNKLGEGGFGPVYKSAHNICYSCIYLLYSTMIQ
ncbi:hypothetical protein CTI12_AA508770 [Artemisia annua]|uniref:Uncharacterized protein n=1 Tax=Artemisia annua TaxID=35608 RepID=A0A2U1L6U3_ARTAN|nr:hypothetical protein CTI12_AA508770 [Artemisia annua]